MPLCEQLAQPADVLSQAPATPSGPPPTAHGPEPPGEAARIWTQKRCEVYEWQPLALGPFESGVACEITRACYGVQEDPKRQLDVTPQVRMSWDSQNGLHLRDFNRLFGDPAQFHVKTLRIEYRLSNVRSWDVSRGSYTEGVGAVGMLPAMVMKTAANVVGVALAASGYAVGKAVTAVKRTVGSDHEASVADSEVFQAGFKSWLKLNGIFPSVSYEPIGDDRLSDDMKQTPLIVSNHMCYLDGLVLAAVFGAPKIIAKEGTLSAPVIGLFAGEIGVIEVNRSDKASRTKTLDAIRHHVAEWRPGSRPLLLFPEGTTSNGDGILHFRKGAFVPGAPVRPVVLTYTGSWHPANTNFKTTSSGELEPTNDLEWCKQFLGHFVHSLQVLVLRPYEPSEAERADPQLYADNVHALMAAAYERSRQEKQESPKRMTRLWDPQDSRGSAATPSQAGSGSRRAHAMPMSATDGRRSRALRKQ